jgi:hypothetical protein
MPQATELTLVQGVLLVMFFGLFFYVWGAANLEGLMNYPFWRDMGPMMTNENFIKLRADHLWKIAPLLVIPFVALVLVTTALAFLAPPFVPRWALVVVLALELVGGVSTIFIQVPIQLQHNAQGYDLATFNRLITTDFWLRKVPRFIEAPFVMFVLWRVLFR